MPWLAAVAPLIPSLVGAIGGLIGQQSAANQAKHTVQDIPTWGTLSNASSPFNPTTFGTGTSAVSPSFVQIDPTLAGLRQNILGNMQGLYPQAGGLYGSLLSEAGMNNNDFVNASVNPLARRLDAAFGDLMMNQGRRLGIRGTEFGNNEISNFAADAGSALADATSLARARGIGLRSDLADKYFTSQLGILSGMENINQDQLRQELAALGLQQHAIDTMVQRQDLMSRVLGGSSAGQGAGLMNLGSSLGSIIGKLPIGGGGGGGVNIPSGM